jgi:NitT/TauT family transport system ATP-binding protein
MSFLSVEDLSITYPTANGGLRALEGVSFSVQRQEFICVIGPSGSGKSTLLKVLAGLLPPTEGRVWLDGTSLTGPSDRISPVFQKANLMPWRSVLANVMLPLELRAVPVEERQRRARDLIELVGLTGFEYALPADLSGGMEQKVAIARALITRADVLLLDEPFGALDALTRERMGAELLRIWEACKTTVVMVTHSIPEALLLADRVLVLSPRPGHVKLEVPAPLPRPRALAMEYQPEFGELVREVRAAIE